MELLVSFNLPAPSALLTAHVIVDRLIAISADRDDEFWRAHLYDFLYPLHDSLGKVTISRKIDQREVPTFSNGSFNYLGKVFAEPHLAAGKVDPIKPIRAPKELSNLV